MGNIKTVLITGGYGLIGRALTQRLLAKGYEVRLLSRNPKSNDQVKAYRWDVDSNYIDTKALDVDCIIHLAGENIAASRWTAQRKQAVIDSRVKSTALLYKALMSLEKRPQLFIAASATGYYGAVTNERIFTEDDPASNDFLGQTCIQWETAVDQVSQLNMRVVKLRTGVVLSARGGALEKMVMPVKLGIGSAIGSGKQYFPWIHLDDLCSMYIYAIENTSLNGAYNAVSPEFIDNRHFTKTLAKVLKRPFVFPAVPAFVLRLLFGELAVVLLEGSRVSAEKIQQAGFAFSFTNSTEALKDLLKK